MMKTMALTLGRIGCIALFCLLGLGADQPAAYSNNFAQAALGKTSDDLMILNGSFAVVDFKGTKCLELSPDPLDGDGMLFGPPGMIAGTVGARIWASSTGKRYPEFGIGSNDAGGWKLIVVPIQKILELRHGDDAKASAPYSWKSKTWTRLRLEVSHAADGTFSIRGKAWPDGAAEPSKWMIAAQDASAPPAGRASIWGMPYSGQPLRFDDLSAKPE